MEQIKLVIVDDDSDIRYLMKMKLQLDAPHFAIDVVESAEQCLEYLTHNRVDCILSDYQLYECSGMDLLLRLRGSSDNTPFIFITGQEREGLAREAFKNGAFDYFTKDIGFAYFARIINSVEQAVRQRRSEDRLALLQSACEAARSAGIECGQRV